MLTVIKKILSLFVEHVRKNCCQLLTVSETCQFWSRLTIFHRKKLRVKMLQLQIIQFLHFVDRALRNDSW